MGKRSGDPFVITEIIEVGSVINRKPFQFIWDRAHRNIPFKPWPMPTKLRTKRRDYPGGIAVTEQVLGPNFEPFLLRGRWADKFNGTGLVNPFDSQFEQVAPGPGYAMRTLRAFEQMVQQGNRVRMQFQDIVIEGLITDLLPTYEYAEEIKYEFTFSPHHRQPRDQVVQRSPRTVLNARQLRDEIIQIRDEAFAVHDTAPRLFITGVLHSAVDAALLSWDDNIVAIDDVTAQRTSVPVREPGDAVRKLSALFLRLKDTGLTMIELLRAADSETSLFFEAAPQILTFDAWSRGIQARARDMIVAGERAATQLNTRAAPDSVAIYRPQVGENLYAVSLRFYNTPHNWRRIVARNNLGNEFVLTGEELLIIPEATSR